MNAMNQIIIEGNVTKAPSAKELPGGAKLCILPIAVNRIYKDSKGNDVDEVGYYDIEVWGEKFSEIIMKLGFTGRGVRIVGRLKQDRWKDDSGNLHSKIYIVAEHVDFKPFKKKVPENMETADNKEKQPETVEAQAVQAVF